MSKQADEHIVVQLYNGKTELIENEKIIGRSRSCALCEYLKEFDTVSRRHAKILIDEKAAYVIDVGTNGNGSTNGTYLNGVKIEANKACKISVGDRISLGPDVHFTVLEVVLKKEQPKFNKYRCPNCGKIFDYPADFCDNCACQVIPYKED